MSKKIIFTFCIFALLIFQISFLKSSFAQRDPSEDDSYLPRVKSEALSATANQSDEDEEKDEGIKIIPIIDITALGTFSQVLDSEESFGIDANAIISPVIKFDDQNYLIPLYNGSYSDVRQVVTEDEGGRIIDSISNQNFSLEYKHIASPEWTYRVKGFSRYQMRLEE